MSLSAKREYALLAQDEIALLRGTHHPEIYELNRQQLTEARTRLRDLRDKSRTLTRQKQREARGKADQRGKSFPGTAEHPLKRKQLFAAALKRVNKEIDRLDRLEAKTRHVEAAHRALAQVRTAKFEPVVPASRAAGGGMQPEDSLRRRRVFPRSKVGRVLKRNKVAQAVRDARPG